MCLVNNIDRPKTCRYARWKINITTNPHIPVLLEPVLEVLSPQKGESYLDVTAGYGGHTSAVLERTEAPENAILVDRDQMAIEVLGEKFGSSGVKIMKHDFYTASVELHAETRQFDVILADLGISSPHIDKASRGFAFMQEGPLDMRMDQQQALSAETIVNTYSEADIATILKRYGDEPRAKRIAALIVASRPVSTTTELAKIIAKAYPGYSRMHPATRTFQGLRIAVNDELELLRKSLPLWLELLAPGGRLGVISFHSLEDRIVKDVFKEAAGDRYDTDLRLLTKRPITAGQDELVFNPRARSAKLRAVAKIKNKEREAHANSG
jgi:16S rRNA (cytosine1402-N4)-methyltransferase